MAASNPLRFLSRLNPFKASMKAAPGASGFEGGRSRRRLSNWRPSSATVNALLAANGAVLLARARELARNNGYIKQAKRVYVTSLVGTGIKPKTLVQDRATRDAIRDLFNDWAEVADADGRTDFFGLQGLVAAELFEAGEVFVRFRPRRLEDGLPVPFQVEVIQAEMLPLDHNGQADNGNTIKNGVEFDFRNQRVAYWFLRDHPGEIVGNNGRAVPNNVEKIRVPAEEVIHIFESEYAGQVRGVSMVAAAIVKAWLLDHYDDAELDRKKTAAMFAGFITSKTPDAMFADVEDIAGSYTEEGDPVSYGQNAGEGDGNLVLEPGILQSLLPGEEITFSQPADVGGTYDVFQTRVLFHICAAMGLPYAEVTGDMRGSNYSRSRQAMVQFRRQVEVSQWRTFIPQFCRAVWVRFITDAVLFGALDLPEFARNPRPFLRVRHITPAWPWVDPLKDRQAEKLAVESLFKPHSDVVEAEGYDAEEVYERIAADKKLLESLGLAYPVAAKPAAAPASPAEEPAEDEDDAEDGDDQQRKTA
jgi:lambda family phage portal protein